MKDRRKTILIILFIFFAAAQAFFMYKRVHNYPFMIYDMYSRPEKAVAMTSEYVIAADGVPIRTTCLPLLQEGMLLNSIHIYDICVSQENMPWERALDSRIDRISGKFLSARMDRQLRISGNDLERYPSWLHEYLEDKVLKRKISLLEVYSSRFDSRYFFDYGDRLVLTHEWE